MNRFFLFLAIFFLAFFAACSDDKGPCDDGPSKECLIGNWSLKKVLRTDGGPVSTKEGFLEFKSTKNPKDPKAKYEESYEFKGGENSLEFVGGTWSVSGKTLTIKTDDGETLNAEIVLNGADIMSLKSTSNKAVISLLQDGSAPTPIEEFTRR